MKALLLISIAAAMLIVATPAGAHPGSWHWSTGLCKHRIVADDVEYDDGRLLDVTKAYCYGNGTHIWNDARTKRLYKHFSIAFRGSGGNWRCAILHVTGEYAYRVSGIALAGKSYCK